MPEGPELHLASLFVNRVCEGVVFTGAVEKSEVSKCPEVPFACNTYRISATSRGKEVRLTLTPFKGEEGKGRAKAGVPQPMDVVFRFGMSGYFRFTTIKELPKHAHLRFYTNEKPCQVLSYVDPRRFGSWVPNGTWQTDRGPCVMSEYQIFRDNVLSHLSDRAFDKPICEALLNQKYFNGIGNYLRAEILYRSNIPPFVMARTVLEVLQPSEQSDLDKKPTKERVKVKSESPDLLSLCHTVPLEVVKLGGKGYDPEKADYSVLVAWMKCYNVEGMKSVRDHNGRTMWFKGDPGPMVPKGSKSPKAKKAKKRIKKEEDDEIDHKKVSKKKRAETKNKKVKQENGVKKEKEGTGKRTGRKKGRGGQNKQTVTQRGASKRSSAGRKSTAAGAVVPRRQSGRVTRGSTKRNS
ncbi:endonuclease 8-like 1 [Megalops cyprinoides]|uniref:endonuclease 8-like 1 n=1 Tax=Megalops cyprinoides TaxID=118141 RepID=UPI0018652312|nr:endonuclease 8-like 1 [Megalops cyprinoides]XP_036391549.1 endonuclease 8-like 1 [Megalops cyprinoides]